MTKKPDYYVARDHHTGEIIAILTPGEYEKLEGVSDEYKGPALLSKEADYHYTTSAAP